MNSRSNPTLLSVFMHDPYKIGGIEMFARELSAQLAERGCDSALYFNANPPPSVRQFLQLPNVRLSVLPERSAKVLHINDFLDCLRSVRPRILHLHFTGLINPLLWLARCNGVGRIFSTDHQSRQEGPVRKCPAPKRWAARLITWPLTKRIAVSRFILMRNEREGIISPGKLYHIYNGIDLRRVCDVSAGRSYRNRLGISSDRLVVMQVGSLIPEKGGQLLISALAKAIPRNPLLHGLLVGKGPLAAEMRQQAERSGIAKHLTFAQVSVDPFGEGVFAAADLVCCPSVWEEAFGFTLPEAMAHQKPVIATAVGAIPEIVEDGKTAFLIERNDVDTLTEKILQLAADAELRKRIGLAAQDAVRRRFNLTERVSELLRVYDLGNFSSVPLFQTTASTSLTGGGIQIFQ